MKEALQEVLIFAGTTEGRRLSEYLAGIGIRHTVCVATEYGRIVLAEHPLRKVRQGRMNQEEIAEYVRKEKFAVVVDATHPFARDVTCNIKAALEEIKENGITVPYLRLRREAAPQTGDQITFFETNEACAQALESVEGNILLTTGSKELPVYCISEGVKSRLYVRVLPSIESLLICREQGIYGKRIIAMQGPFTVEMNEAVIRQYHITCLVTKESGVSGGCQEKLWAAKRAGIRSFVIGRPKEEEGDSFSAVCGKLTRICGKRSLTEMSCGNTDRSKNQDEDFEMILAGMGMGRKGCLTREVEEAIDEADLLLGAERLIENLRPGLEKHPFYQAGQIIPYLKELKAEDPNRERRKVVILFSGDTGFCSGCQSLYDALQEEIQAERIRASIRVMPGISSVAYLASCIGVSYQDAAIYSMHGKKLSNLARRIKCSPKTFLLTSGVSDVRRLGEILTEAGMAECQVITGYQLSYEEQRIERHAPSECCTLEEEGLYTCFVWNPCASAKRVTHGMKDEEFLRGRVPMTKEEVRDVSICKLCLKDRSIVYDIGSGTGSVAVEIAARSPDIQVYAIEQKEEAVALIRQNKEKFALENITVTEAAAPGGLAGLPMATHAFIGGSGGRLKEIIDTLCKINPVMRIVINAVSIETVSKIKEVLSMYRIEKEEIVQLQVSRARKMGSHHLMLAENPVWICAFDLCGQQTGEYDEYK